MELHLPADGTFADGISTKQKWNKLLSKGLEMLTDTALKALKPKEKDYKLTGRDGMYVLVKRSFGIVFRLDYRLHGRCETLTIGKYGRDGITRAEARDRCIEARRAIRDGKSPAQEKQREKRKFQEAKSSMTSRSWCFFGRPAASRFSSAVSI
jgi:hypothetical protein